MRVLGLSLALHAARQLNLTLFWVLEQRGICLFTYRPSTEPNTVSRRDGR